MLSHGPTHSLASMAPRDIALLVDAGDIAAGWARLSMYFLIPLIPALIWAWVAARVSTA
jgi:anaerobic C4-dicarboxylate transporter